MKRITVILLICIYVFSILGVGIRQFYCCGKLKSITISFAQTTKVKCSKGDERDGCCKTKYKIFKVKDTHFAATDVSCPVHYFIDLPLFTSSFTITASITEPENITNPGHAPPLHHGVPIYVFDCVYRI